MQTMSDQQQSEMKVFMNRLLWFVIGFQQIYACLVLSVFLFSRRSGVLLIAVPAWSRRRTCTQKIATRCVLRMATFLHTCRSTHKH
jgi:hypothetical protein